MASQAKNSKVSYSKIAINFQFPKKNQAVIVDTLDNVRIEEYLHAIKGALFK